MNLQSASSLKYIMAAIDKSLYEKFIIESVDGQRTADISAGVVSFNYYENLFSPMVTGKVVVVNTGIQ